MKAAKTKVVRVGNGKSVFADGVRRLNFVCFKCRISKKCMGGTCQRCGKVLTSLGERIKVPPKHKEKDWKQLEASFAKWN